MMFRIHFEWPDGTEDSIVVAGETIEEVRDRANAEIASRGAKPDDAWSEELETT